MTNIDEQCLSTVRKTPELLWPALRQYQSNDCSRLLAGFDYEDILKILYEEIIKAHIAGQKNENSAQDYARSLGLNHNG